MPADPFQQLAAALALSSSPEAFAQAAQSAVNLCDQITGPAVANLACREGCALCCWLRVDVFAHEVFLIAHHILTHFSEVEIAGLLVRLAAHVSAVAALTPFEHATRNVPCPLLREGRCSIYAARPHSCRRHHSLDFSACQFTFDHPKDLAAPAAHGRDLFRALSEVMQLNIETYAGAGFDPTIYELGTALHEALHDPSSWERWRHHAQAFLRASVTPAG